MALDEVGICNQGLIALGEDPILNFEEGSKAARLCAAGYDMIRDEVLRDAKWNFALGRKQLAKLVTVPEFEFSAEHQLPDDCLRVLALSDRLAEYKVEGRKILSNLDTVKIHYIRRITDTTQFDSMFVAALAAGIAKALAIPLTDSDSRHNAMVVLYDDKISAAKGADAQENGSIETIEADEWINARRGGGSVT